MVVTRIFNAFGRAITSVKIQKFGKHLTAVNVFGTTGIIVIHKYLYDESNKISVRAKMSK